MTTPPSAKVFRIGWRLPCLSMHITGFDGRALVTSGLRGVYGARRRFTVKEVGV